MAKLNRERGLAERRLAKQARKAARKQAASQPQQEESSGLPSQDEEAQPGPVAEADAQEQTPE